MKKLLTLITLGCLSSCYTQKTVEVIDQSYTHKGCTEEIKVYTNFEAYDEFQRSLVIPGQRNKPLQIIDFSDKNIAPPGEQSVAATGNPIDIASIIVFGIPSNLEDKTKIPSFFIDSGTFVTIPGIST